MLPTWLVSQDPAAPRYPPHSGVRRAPNRVRSRPRPGARRHPADRAALRSDARAPTTRPDPVTRCRCRRPGTRPRGAATDVDSLQAALAAANQRLESSSIAAAQAAEAYNGARWQAEQARKASRLAAREAAAAAADYEQQADFYADTVVTAYETMPELSGLTAVLESDDLGTMLDRSSTLENASDAMDQREDDFRDGLATGPTPRRDRADAAEADAVAAKAQAEEARDQARAAADAAAAEAQSVAAEKTRLIGELARLQGVSVELAAQRQAGLEQRAGREGGSRSSREAAAQQAAEEAAEAAAEQAAQEAAEQAAQDAAERRPTSPTDETATEPEPTSPTPPRPPPGGGAAGGDRLRPRPDRRALRLGCRRPRAPGTARA